jgi:hypothetical protein
MFIGNVEAGRKSSILLYEVTSGGWVLLGAGKMLTFIKLMGYCTNFNPLIIFRALFLRPTGNKLLKFFKKVIRTVT